MLRRSSTIHQPNLFRTDLLIQLDVNDPLLKLAGAIPWQEFDEAFSFHYTKSTVAEKNMAFCEYAKESHFDSGKSSFR
jgi:IS5 family transposase